MTSTNTNNGAPHRNILQPAGHQILIQLRHECNYVGKEKDRVRMGYAIIRLTYRSVL
jgi:hypothetical protein